MSTWPPPTNGMTADELKKLHDVSVQSVEHSMQCLKVQCAKEGHVWGKETSDRFIKGQVDTTDYTDCSWSHPPAASYAGGYYVTVFKRICTRCGLEESKEAVTQESSPFAHKP